MRVQDQKKKISVIESTPNDKNNKYDEDIHQFLGNWHVICTHNNTDICNCYEKKLYISIYNHEHTHKYISSSDLYDYFDITQPKNILQTVLDFKKFNENKIKNFRNSQFIIWKYEPKLINMNDYYTNSKNTQYEKKNT